jgi:hypothetical protein
MANNEFAHPQSAEPRVDSNVPEAAAVVVGSGAWRAVLLDEEGTCQSFGFGAAVVSISVPLDLDSPDAPGGAMVDAVRGALRSTDRIGLLSPTELTVLLIPLASIHEARAIVATIDAALRQAAGGTRVGWALRVPRHDLLHAAAHADAAMARARPSSRLPARGA